MRDEFDEGLAGRLRAYESRIPDAEPPAPGRRGRGPWPAVAGAALLVVAVLVGARLVVDRAEVGDASPTASPSATPEASTPSISATASASVAPTASVTPTPRPTPTPGPIARWATTATFAEDGFAIEVRDVAYAASHFIALGLREPLGERGQVGPSTATSVMWISPDGRAWEPLPLSGEMVGAHLATIATLPDGSAVVYGSVDRDPDPDHEDLESPVAWRSTDGRSWSRLAVDLPHDTGSPDPELGFIRSGPLGHLTVHHYLTEVGLSVEEVWYSPDGVAWEVVRRFTETDDGWVTLVRDVGVGDEGFVLVGERFEVDAVEREYVPVIQASADARTWHDADPDAMPSGTTLLVAPVGPDWILTQTNYDGRPDGTWFSHDGLRWIQRQALDVPDPEPPDGLDEATSIVGRIVPAGDRAFITGATVVCCHHPWWAAGIWSSTDATSWERLDFPLGTVIAAAAVHGDTTVLVGHMGATLDGGWKARGAMWVGER